MCKCKLDTFMQARTLDQQSIYIYLALNSYNCCSARIALRFTDGKMCHTNMQYLLKCLIFACLHCIAIIADDFRVFLYRFHFALSEALMQRSKVSS